MSNGNRRYPIGNGSLWLTDKGIAWSPVYGHWAGKLLAHQFAIYGVGVDLDKYYAALAILEKKKRP